MATVLVIEDNPVNMKLAALLLRNAGHAVLCAGDAETGLVLARTDRPDLVLMDFQLPGMDGLAATALLKRDPVTAAIPVIALTALAIKADPGQVAGCDAYIAKPLRYQELYAAMNALLPKGIPPACAPDAASGSPDQAQASTRAAGARAVDVGMLESLVGSDPDVIVEFLDAFRVSAAKIAPELKTACADNRPVQAGKQAHKLKSAAHAVGAQALAGLCAEMETAGKAGSMETLTALLPKFERELADVNADLDSLTLRN